MPSLSPQLLAALQEFSVHPRILVALDFDGTLSPLVDKPQDARPLPESAELVEQLGRLPGVYTAVISGRNLDSLAEVYPEPLPEIRVGSHGAERRLPAAYADAWTDSTLTAEQTQLLNSVTDRLQKIADKHHNVNVEYKPSATVLHVRQASDETASVAMREAILALEQLEGIKLMSGKAVLEASVLNVNKGEALAWLRTRLDVQAVLFIGDDVTDENGFKVLTSDDIGIKVGSGATAATHHIESPFEIPDLLKSLISMRD
ncbi:trehalose-phosphatase [Glutamicibacter sp. NPDC087344]|uniref:trehalose-phosphatase n=1 Tax=Glutamicibacter sp. NPDC087344 TaxID=3363994 RepID=UPI003829BD14